jgi:release factor glutamine methyltransferase
LLTVASVLASAPTGMPTNELRLLLGAVLKQPTVWLITHNECPLNEEQKQTFGALVSRRLNGEPMSYLLGYREFYGREFSVSTATLIPRPETELLVDLVKVSVGADDTPSILDMGTGSGCIAISIALECRGAVVTGIDMSRDALDVATTNMLGLNANVEFLQSDWYAALGDRRFDIIVSNPPYIAIGDAHLDQGDLRFEPQQALSSGNDGLEALRTIVAGAPTHLKPKGMLALEHGYDQAEVVGEMLRRAGFTQITQRKDIAGITRVSCGVLP